jgi:ABC-2 type transport system ATP-binding protein
MANISVEAIHLTKHYGAYNAVDDVSFSGSQGEIIGLLGPNGAGKTTTIRLLTTVLGPTRGEFSIAGHQSTAATEIRRCIGVLPETSGYPSHQTGGEYLRFYARLYGLSRRQARSLSAELLAAVGLEQWGRSRISIYSRGMRQRLGIARALVNDPSVVFLDEPTLGLDPAGQAQVLDIIRTVATARRDCRTEHSSTSGGGASLLQGSDLESGQGGGVRQCRGGDRQSPDRALCLSPSAASSC